MSRIISATLTRNQLNRKVPWVRIPPAPPSIHRNFDRITVDFFYARKPLEIKAFAVSEHKRTPLQSNSAAGFARFMGFAAVCAVVIVKRLGQSLNHSGNR